MDSFAETVRRRFSSLSTNTSSSLDEVNSISSGLGERVISSPPIETSFETLSEDTVQPLLRQCMSVGALPGAKQQILPSNPRTTEKKNFRTAVLATQGSLRMKLPWVFGRSSDKFTPRGSLKGMADGRKKVAPIMAEIAFDSGSTQYCIVKPMVRPADLYEHVILPEWGLQAPKLVLSIMGGAGNMQLDSRFDSESFSKGLVEAALRTGAWVITGGTKSGVMEMVGKAMKQHDKQRQVPCLGISPLGGLTSRWREALQQGISGAKVDAARAKPEADAPPEKDGKIPLAEIQDNHTHSILVDSGLQGGKAFGTESSFRAEFESWIVSNRHHQPLLQQANSRGALPSVPRRSASNIDREKSAPDFWMHLGKTSTAPRVMILVNGGKISLQALLEAISKGCPIVLCEGTGRLSDLLCEILHGVRDDPDCDFKELCNHAKSLHMKTEELSEKEVDMAEKIIKSGAVEIYTISERLEDVILRAVLEGPMTDHRRSNVDVRSQLLLAVQWGCTDYFDLLGRKLVQECGGERDGPAKAIEFIFKHIVNAATVTKVKDRQAESKARGDLVNWLLKNHRKQMEEFQVTEGMGRIEWNHLSCSSQALEGLLLWSIEHEAPLSVLEALWNHMEDPVHAALIAASCCRETAARGHSSSSGNDALLHKNLTGIADRFERLAILVLDDLAKAGKDVEYLFQESSRWMLGDQKCTTCFRLAHTLGCKKFVASTFYSLAVDFYWMTPVPFHIKKKQLDPKYVSLSNLPSLLVNPSVSDFTVWELLSIPAIKMYTHGLARLIFVVIYSYAVFYGRLTYTGIQPMELVLFVWGLGLAQVEVSQMMEQNSFWEYIRDFWNCLDCLYITLMMGTLVAGLFLSDNDPDTSRTEHALEVIHALCLLPSWIRVLQLLQLSKYFGTLLMTICGMVKDALRFFIMVGIFCFAFSCALTPILFVSASERESHGLLWAFWMIVGDSGGLDKARERVSEQETFFMRSLTQLLLYTLALVSNVLLVNLLIAVMNSTYEQNQVASQTEWEFYHINAVLEFEGEQKLPPPLNLLERWLPKSSQKEEEQHRPLARSKTVDLPINKRDLKDSQQRAFVAVGLEEDVGEAALLRSENADLRRRNAELAVRNADLERMAANYLLQEATGSAAMTTVSMPLAALRHKPSERDLASSSLNLVDFPSSSSLMVPSPLGRRLRNGPSASLSNI